MTDLSDRELLAEFNRSQSGAAFAELVRRHLALVHSVALRHTDNPESAREITQAVFIILARKAASLGRGTVLGGWLHHTARLTAANFRRAEFRRVRREQEAFMQSTLTETSPENAWRELAPLLDEAVAHLGATDRAAVVLRYFKNQSLAEVGAALGASEDAAKKRVARALEKLRKFFAHRGVALSATAIAGAVSAHSVQAAPAGLGKTISVVAAAKGAAAGGSTLTLVKGALKIMAWTKMKTAVVVGASVLLAAGTTDLIVKSDFLAAREPSYQGRSLVEWLPDVDSGRPPDQRAKAAEAIRHMGAATLPFLLNDLMFDPRLARHPVRYLKPDSRPGDERSRQACWAFDALGPLGKPAIPELTRLLEQNAGYVPGALVGIGREALPQIFNALTNSSFFVRDNTAAALANAVYAGKITPDDAEPALPVAINNLTYADTNQLFLVNTRFRAVDLINALALEPDLSVPALAQELTDTNLWVAAESAQALGRFGTNGGAAVPALVKAVASTNAELSCAAAWSLSQIDPHAYIQSALAPALALTNSQNSSIRLRLAASFGYLGSRGSPVVPALIWLLSDSNDVVRMVAAQSLGQIAGRPEEVLPALRRGLEDTSQVVRMESVNALGKFGSAAWASVPDLIAAANAHPELKGNVHMALSQIDPKAAANFK